MGGDDYEDVHILDYDHSDICKPATIKDRRYTEYHTFITTKVYDAAKDLMVYGRQEGEVAETKLADDEKEEAAAKVLVVDPGDVGLSDKYIKMRELRKNPDMRNFTAVLAAMFKEEAESMRQQNIQSLFQDDIISQNKKILENLLTT